MKWRRGPRPWSIHLFAILFLAVAIVGLAGGLIRIDDYNYLPINPATGEALSRDEKIVFISAEFTIVCIPIVAIWLFGSRVARWIVTTFVLLGAVFWISQMDEHYWAWVWEGRGETLLALSTRFGIWIAVFLLFLPPSVKWLRNEQIDLETFA